MKKFLCIFLSALMIFNLFNAGIVLADDINYQTATEDMFSSIAVYRGYVRINKYDCDYENIYIPKTMEYNSKEYPVMFNSEVFINNTIIKNIMIADGVALFGEHARLFYGAKNLVTAKIENNGSFLNPEIKTGTCSEFNGCSSLKECYDLSQYSCCKKVILEGVNSLKEISSLPENAQSYTIRGTSLQSICDIPESAEKIVLQLPSINNDIYILSENVASFKLLQQSSNSYINDISITIFVPNNSKTIDTLLRFQASHHNVSIATLDNSDICSYENIYCIGDSLTAGGYYTSTLQNLLGDKTIVHKYGAESDCVINGVYRSGTEKITVTEPALIPYSKTKVKIQLSADFCKAKAKVAQDNAGVNCCKIGDVEGFLSYENDNYYFQRAQAGRVTKIEADSAVETEFSMNYKKGDTLVLYFGTNDFMAGSYTSEKTVNLFADKLQKIIDYCQCKNYIVVGIAFGGGIKKATTSNENMQVYDSVMSERFSNHYLNMREYFIKNCREICSDIELSKEEEDLLSRGIVPPVFYFDQTTHWNVKTGGKVAAQAIYEKLSQLGYKKTVVEPTCTNQGYTLNECILCDDEYKTDYVQPIGHSYKTTIAKATTNKNGSVATKCSVCGELKSKTTIYYPKTISLSATNYTYDGKVKTPSATVKDSKGKTLKKNTDYTVTYAKGRKNVGKYAVTIKFKGNYSGSKTLYFTIKPKATSISRLTAGKKKFTVRWKKLTTQTTGYQIQYSTSSKFKSSKTVTIGKNKTTSKTISNLKAKKKYYVRIRTYKTVKINGKSIKIYSSWSKAKSAVIK